MNSDILPPDFTVKSLEEEYTSWRKQVDFDKLIKCLWTPSQVESFWSAANWSENNVRKIRELLLQVHKLHPHLKRVVAIIYQLKRFLPLDSHCLHLLRPSSLEHHYRHQEVSLKNVIESSKSFVKELNRFSKLRTLRIQQMKYSLSQLQVLQSWEQSINKQLMESFLARDLQDHPSLELDEVRSRRYKRKLKTPPSCMNKLLKAGA